MTKEKVTAAVGMISDRHILSVSEHKPRKSRKPYYISAVAACLLLCVVIAPFAIAYSLQGGGDHGGDNHGAYGIYFETPHAAFAAIGEDDILRRAVEMADEITRLNLELRGEDPSTDGIDCYEDHRDRLIRFEFRSKVDGDMAIIYIVYNGVTKPYYLGEHMPSLVRSSLIGTTPVEYVYDEGLDQLDAKFRYKGIDYCLQYTSAEPSEEKLLSYLEKLLTE